MGHDFGDGLSTSPRGWRGLGCCRRVHCCRVRPDAALNAAKRQVLPMTDLSRSLHGIASHAPS
jgi:hypothetical protein